MCKFSNSFFLVLWSKFPMWITGHFRCISILFFSDKNQNNSKHLSIIVIIYRLNCAVFALCNLIKKLDDIKCSLLGPGSAYIHIYYTSHNALQYCETNDAALCWLVRELQ